MTLNEGGMAMDGIVKRIVNSIKAERFDFENVQKRGTYYGHRCNVQPLFCSYGQIGWTVEIPGNEIKYDYELDRIEVEEY